MNTILVISIIILNLFDLIVSYTILSPDSEANPLMQFLWDKGFTFVVLFKLSMLSIALFCLFLLRKTNRFRLALIVINLILLYTCARLVQYHILIEASKKEIQHTHERYLKNNPIFKYT